MLGINLVDIEDQKYEVIEEVHEMSDIPCCTRSNHDEFFQEFMIKNKPCLIVDCIKSWPCARLWVKNHSPDVSYLRSTYGKSLVPVAHCNEKYFDSQRKTIMPFNDYLDYWEQYVNSGHPSLSPCLYVKDWHLVKEYPNDSIYRVPHEFCCDWLNEYCTECTDTKDDYQFVYMGPKGSWTPFHADVFSSYSWSVNICGLKKWILLAPGEEDKIRDKLGNLPYDFNSFPHEHVKYFTVIQKPGDAIFVPSGWHHQVWNLEDTISINHNWINGCNIQYMWKSLKLNFEAVKNEIMDLKDVCDDWNDQCQILLKSVYGINYEEFHQLLLFIYNKRYKHLDKVLKVHGNWSIGKSLIKFEIQQCTNILLQFYKQNVIKKLTI